jgi:hypothetical protein
MRASIIGPWHFGHGPLATAIGGISAVCLGSAIAFHPGSDGSAKLSVTGSRRAGAVMESACSSSSQCGWSILLIFQNLIDRAMRRHRWLLRAHGDRRPAKCR